MVTSLVFGSLLVGAAVATTSFGAVMLDDEGLMPRQFLSEFASLQKRDGSCPSDSHPCRDVKSEEDCCPNNSFCYVDKSHEVKCCPIGGKCDEKCPRNSYLCYATVTVTVTPSASGTSSGTRGAPFETVSRPDACCNRQCPNNKEYKCPNDKCCPYGFECRKDQCIKVVQPEAPPLVRPIPEGCTSADQTPCQDQEGCCKTGYDCVRYNGSGWCSPAAAPTDNSTILVDEPSQELSDGAKAGIAVGTVFGAGIIIAAVTWFCISRRRRRRDQTATQQSASAAGRPHPIPIPDNMTELTASTRVPGLSHGHDPRHNVSPDYFSSRGPYSEPIASTAATSPNPDRGVPLQPGSPSDIAVPVEIDSRPHSPESPTANSYYATPMSRLDETAELHAVSNMHYTMPPRQRSPSLQYTPRAVTPRDELP